jgi:hypothetical protein
LIYGLQKVRVEAFADFFLQFGIYGHALRLRVEASGRSIAQSSWTWMPNL